MEMESAVGDRIGIAFLYFPRVVCFPDTVYLTSVHTEAFDGQSNGRNDR